MLTYHSQKYFPAVIIMLFVFIVSPVMIYSQPDMTFHNEVMDDEYVPVDRDQMGRSPAYRFTMDSIITVQVNVDSTGQNITGDAANEPSIAVDKNNPSRMVIGWRQFSTITSNFRQAGFGYTTDRGMNWTFPGVIEPGVFRSDPVLGSDSEGNMYYNSLTSVSSVFVCDVFKSNTGGSSWGPGVDAKGGDKQWMVIDKTAGTGNGNFYAYWTEAWSMCIPDFFTRSTDNGASFQNCISIPNDPYWGTLAVGPGGELYVAGSAVNGNNFTVAKSVNAQNPGVTPTWSLTTSVNLDGSITYGIDPNPGGLGGQTWVAVDTSGGPYHGNVYVLCSVERNSNTDPSDVMFASSTNGGINWSAPVRINDDVSTSNFQWFGTMSVAPNGRIDVIWLDTRDNPGSSMSALYYSGSTDGGATWSPNMRLSDFFNSLIGWPSQNKMGDYFDMISDSVGAHLAWAATFTGGQDVYYSYISASVIVPVELLSFTAVTGANTVTLNWSTATETNNYGFEIERSTDRTQWITIGFKEGKGTTSEPQHYSFTDRLIDVTASRLYYRLKQVDFNGRFEYSEAAEALVAGNFTLAQNYPNPFNPFTRISYQVPVSGLVTLKVFDVLGNEIASLVNEEQSAGTYELEFNAQNLTSGVYFYKLQAGDYSSTKRMVLMK